MSDSATMGLFIMSNPVFECYAFYSSILILKLIAMSFLTVIQRFRKKVRKNTTLSTFHIIIYIYNYCYIKNKVEYYKLIITF